MSNPEAQIFRDPSACVESVLRQASSLGSTSLSLFPSGGVVVYAVDRSTHEGICIPPNLYDEVVGHLKAISGLDPKKNNEVQKGSCGKKGQGVMLALTFTPTKNGEAVQVDIVRS